MGPYNVHKEVKSTQKQPSFEEMVRLKSLGEKSYEIKDGGQEIVAMVLMLKKLIMAVCIVKIY